MTAINHAITGSIIGLTISNPFIAVPLAFISHYLLDIIPHFGSKQDNDKFIKSKKFKIFLSIDILLCIILAVSLFIIKPTSYLIVILCAFIATTPDLVNLKRFILINLNKEYKPGLLYKMSAFIQWFERPIGLNVEIAWFLASGFILIELLLK